MGSSKPAAVGVFIPWKLASTAHQGLFFQKDSLPERHWTRGSRWFNGGKGSKAGAYSRGYWQRGTPVSLTQASRVESAHGTDTVELTLPL